MDPPPPPPPAAGPSAPAPGFQSASSVLRSTHVPSVNSNRNASGNLPPIPKPAAPAPPRPEDGKYGAAAGSAASTAPPKPVNRPAASKNAIVYSVLQRRNPILPLIRNVGLEIGDIVVDYQVGAHNGVLFLSLKYHRLHPEYIHSRIEKMRHAYNLRILLVLCDIHQQPLRELSKITIINDMTMLVAFSNEEAAQYLTTLKAYEHKSADTLKEKVHQTYHAQLEHVLTSGRKVNKSNAEAIAAQFGSFSNIARQSNHSLSAVKGLGKVKIVSLLDAFNKPFVAGQSDATQTQRRPVAPATVASATADADDDADGIQAATESHEQQNEGLVGSPLVPVRSPEYRVLTPPTPTRPRDQGPSRSPSIQPDDPERHASDAVWRDPLEDDEDDADDADSQRDAKRQRV